MPETERRPAAIGRDADPVWEAFVKLILPMGAVREQASRYGAKPAICLNSREIAHSEAPGLIDLRITRPEWVKIQADWISDSSVTALPGRRDWIELTVELPNDLIRLSPLIAAAVKANE